MAMTASPPTATARIPRRATIRPATKPTPSSIALYGMKASAFCSAE